MKTKKMLKKLSIGLGIAIVAGLVTIFAVIPATAATGSVSVSGNNNAKITISISDNTAAFGTNLDPSGPDSNSTDAVTDYQGTTGNEGSYYVWKSASGTGNTIEVKSNKAWNGTISASKNSGTSSSMTIDSGVLRWSEGAEPGSYNGCVAATAFDTHASTWQESVAKGKSTFVHYYCLRVDWDDDPGTFSSTINYEVSQAD